MGKVFILMLLVFVVQPADSTAQPTIQIPDTPACECRFRIERVATLSDPDGRAGLSMPLVIERAPDGRYLVVVANRQSAILVFDSTGRFQRTIGRAGQGPLEFRAVIAIRPGPGDSTFVMDAGNGRIAVLDPELALVRSARVPVIGGWFGVLRDGRTLVLGGVSRTSPPGRGRIQVLNSAMEPTVSFMPGVASGPSMHPETLRHRMSVSAEGVVAVAHNDRYVVEIWSAGGQLLRTLTRNPEWFRSRPESSVEEGPAPRLETPRITADGHVWTVSHVADSNWRDARTTVRDLYGRPVQGVPQDGIGRYVDSVIELLDSSSGRVIASARVDAHLVFVADDGVAAGYREDDAGNPSIDLWRFTVIREPVRPDS